MNDMVAGTLRAEVVAIGDELTTGQRLDTNSQWISRELGLLGVPVGYHTTVTDSLADGVAVFRAAAARAGVVIVTGGLGPTADDLTRDVLAEVAGVALELSPAALADVEARFARRGVSMPESNRRQALFPAGAGVIANPEGTAPGIDQVVEAGDGSRARFFALPGVPSEMRVMWHASVAPAILAMLPGAGTIRFRRVKCFGAGESAIEAMLPDIVRRGREPLVGITAHEATITLRIAARGADAEACAAAIAPTESLIRECLGPLVFGVEDDEIEDAALAALESSGATLATAEEGTHGRVALLLAEAAARCRGAAFVGGVVLEPGHADASDVVVMAERRRAGSGADLALAVGAPGRGADGVGMMPMALAGPDGTRSILHRLGGAGEVRLARAAKTAIDLVRRAASGLPAPS